MSREDIPRKEIASAVYRALGFGPVRGVNPFRALTDTAHNFYIAFQVALQIRNGKKPDFAIADVAENIQTSASTVKCSTLSRSTVARLWRKRRPRISLD